MTPWFLGDMMTIADITAAVAVTFLKRTSPQLFSPSAYPKLEALATKCETMPAFKGSPLETP